MLLLNLLQKGGIVMYPLLGLSFLSVLVICERFFFWIRVRRKRDQDMVSAIILCVQNSSPEEAQRKFGHMEDFVAKTLLEGIKHREPSLTLGLEVQAMVELKKMRKNLVILDTIITAAPLLGILGTVLGIIASFDVLGVQADVVDPTIVTKGISQALLTTAYGLTVALVTIFPYNYFQALYNESAEEIEKNATALEIAAQKNKTQ
jgi:biopolymer transport protein ExbB